MNVANIIILINMQMKNKYDSQHTSLFFKIKDLVKLCLHKDYNILDIKLRKLNTQFVSLFKVIKRIDCLTYKLKLFNIMRIHNVIFIAHLKSAYCSFNDFYKQTMSKSSPVIIKGQNE